MTPGDRTRRRAIRALVALGALVLAAGAVLVVSMALPVHAWRTGEPPAVPLALAPGRAPGPAPIRLWIDTDAACGRSPRTDPDDCLAVLLLAQARRADVVGISTVFGNAPLAVTDSTTRALAAVLRANGIEAPPVHRGASAALDETPARADGTAARDALRGALADGPLVVVALGPLTNVAAALRGRPELRARVRHLVVVMGRRRGHLFHPVEGGTAHSFLGHGPVFRDLNFVQDEAAAASVLAMRMPTTLVPYEAARDVMVRPSVLDGMEARGGAAAWVARRSRGWLAYWRDEINRPGFYPFDAMAAAFVLQPTLLRCADVTVAIERDAGLLGWVGRRGLVVASPVPVAPPDVRGSPAAYCADAAPGAASWLAGELTGR
jgi:inosine-uridine nucleoside N-ribohydrolase